ncbi:thioredoxin domain-containing protein [Spirosoma pollinicola]|uniref:Thioredoxin domain-containing protein n=1 Tax=Spirosoma pollinicola TaxID=2057025 RepID=A0A2K8Z917_9BACT|nr:thioredoxin domain-containing protein [Spirosoma pollinicola]AUD06362.1 thioredoxin domain-containing protein [Spirosoma pollinicola]
MPNQLQYETSPYLLQHAENPVDWYPWGEEALTKALEEDKPILVSIGYSACHWCHVMERESFEIESVAQVMNDHFVCIKVDREERPDVDAIYMDSVQAMGVQGGWPLNVFLMPDAKPFYGLTYMPQKNWVNLLYSIQAAFAEHRADLAQSAEGFARELNLTDAERYGLSQNEPLFSAETLDVLYRKVAVKADDEKGGMRRAPKFPMPSVWRFLLRYYDVTVASGVENEAALHQVKITLDRMALGGIYDQLGGGFARYSTDADWFAPHFEKMLYDNGQLLTLYAEAYSLTRSPLYKHVIYQTINFCQRELLSPEGGFYSALDADSEGVEGKFYTFTTPELKEILGIDFDWFAELYSITEAGNWEPDHEGHGLNILHRTESDDSFAERMGWSPADLNVRLDATHTRLLRVRNERIRPGLDDKILCSWNGLMLKGLATAYRVFGEPEFLTLALRLAFFLMKKMRDNRNGRLWHSYKLGRARQTGFLDDYAAVIDGLLALYQATFTESWLTEADQLMQYVLTNFTDDHVDELTGADPMFFFTDKNGEELIARRKELFDNVIPSSNSMMAENLHALSLLLDRPDYAERADQMLGRVQPMVQQNADYLTNWASQFALRARPTAEIAIVGPDAEQFRAEIDAEFYPNKVLCGTTDKSELPLLQQRGPVEGQTAIYVCYNRACQLPVTSVADVWRLVR